MDPREVAWLDRDTLGADPLDVDTGNPDGGDRQVPTADDLSTDGVPDVVEPGTSGTDEPVGVLLDATVGMALTRHTEVELTAAAEHVTGLRASHDVMLVNVLAELDARGVEPPGGLSRVDWLRALDPGLSAGAAKAFVTLAQAMNQPRWAELRARVALRHVTVANAAALVEFYGRVSRVADPVQLDAVLEHLSEQAAMLRPEELARRVRQESEQLTPPREADRLDEARRQSRGLWFTAPNRTGMVGMSAVLDPEAAAIVKAAVEPLSAPCPGKDAQGHTVEPDPRSPAKRRADALVAIIGRGVSAPDGLPVTDKAKVVVTIDHDVLTGRLAGIGTTATGDVLTAGTVRRLACDAGIIPMVLGRESEPLDVGRQRRLVTKGLRLALIARDRGCSFDNCTVPAQWCDGHHVHHWARGGKTSLLTTALLCPRHHTHVHQHDLTATVTARSVTWHL
ncbi:MAG TPA: DUF222 domain-containing protein [Intrasporangium sp.]|nr:DUF222 domain-containing protein [Intrasporangium sp.]